METITLIFNEFWNTLCEMAPYLLFGFFVAGLLSVFVSQEVVERHLGGRGIWPVVKASFLGVPLPLCSCSVIPVMTSLRRHGASKGAAVSFLLSTPQTGVDSIMATLGLLGPVFAVFRPFAAFISGVIGGGLVDRMNEPDVADGMSPGHCEEECCSNTSKRPKLIRAFQYGFIILPKDIARALVVGLIIAGVIGAVIPASFFSNVLGTGITAMIVMMFLGIPVYVCATASIPIAAAMMMKGITPGAALVFLMTGPATNAATITTVWRVLGRRTAWIYLIVVAGTALCFGLLLDWLFGTIGIPAGGMTHWMLPQGVKIASAIVLMIILGNSFIGPKKACAHEKIVS